MPMPPKKPGGYKPVTQEVVIEACKIIAQGGAIRGAAEQLGVSVGTLLDWLLKPENEPTYSRAREQRAALDVDQIEADEATLRKLAASVQRSTGVDPARAQAAIRAMSEVIGTRRWIAERRDGRRYGNKQQHAITDPDGALTAMLTGMSRSAFPIKRDPDE